MTHEALSTAETDTDLTNQQLHDEAEQAVATIPADMREQFINALHENAAASADLAAARRLADAAPNVVSRFFARQRADSAEARVADAEARVAATQERLAALAPAMFPDQRPASA